MAGMLISTVSLAMIHSEKLSSGRKLQQRDLSLSPIWIVLKPYPIYLVKKDTCHQSGKWWEGNFKHGGFTHGMTRGFPQEDDTEMMDLKSVAMD